MISISTPPVHDSFDPAAIAKLVGTVNEYLATSQALLVTDENLLYSMDKNGALLDDLWFLDQAETGFLREEDATLEENLTAYAASYGPAETLGASTPDGTEGRGHGARGLGAITNRGNSPRKTENAVFRENDRVT